MTFSSTKILNSKTKYAYTFTPANMVVYTDKFYTRIMEICNERLVYETLFKVMCSGSPYTVKNAQEFAKWAKKGFDNCDQFPFFILDNNNLPVGSVGIKSNDLSSAEIGYWLSRKHSGLMTNAVIELSRQAQMNGFESLYALCIPENIQSQNVLLRATYLNCGTTHENDKDYIKFRKSFI